MWRMNYVPNDLDLATSRASVVGIRCGQSRPITRPSKAALINFAEILYNDLAPRGIAVTLVNPAAVVRDGRVHVLYRAEDASGDHDRADGRAAYHDELSRLNQHAEGATGHGEPAQHECEDREIGDHRGPAIFFQQRLQASRSAFSESG